MTHSDETRHGKPATWRRRTDEIRQGDDASAITTAECNAHWAESRICPCDKWYSNSHSTPDLFDCFGGTVSIFKAFLSIAAQNKPLRMSANSVENTTTDFSFFSFFFSFSRLLRPNLSGWMQQRRWGGRDGPRDNNDAIRRRHKRMTLWARALGRVSNPLSMSVPEAMFTAILPKIQSKHLICPNCDCQPCDCNSLSTPSLNKGRTAQHESYQNQILFVLRRLWRRGKERRGGKLYDHDATRHETIVREYPNNDTMENSKLHKTMN